MTYTINLASNTSVVKSLWRKWPSTISRANHAATAAHNSAGRPTVRGLPFTVSRATSATEMTTSGRRNWKLPLPG